MPHLCSIPTRIINTIKRDRYFDCKCSNSDHHLQEKLQFFLVYSVANIAFLRSSTILLHYFVVSLQAPRGENQTILSIFTAKQKPFSIWAAYGRRKKVAAISHANPFPYLNILHATNITSFYNKPSDDEDSILNYQLLTRTPRSTTMLTNKFYTPIAIASVRSHTDRLVTSTIEITANISCFVH